MIGLPACGAAPYRMAATTNGSSISLTTLAVTAVASAAAAYACSKIWAQGSLAAAAFTPVAVAVLKELLQRPATVVTRAVPVRGMVRHAPEPAAPAVTAEPERVAQAGEVQSHASGSRRRRGLQLAIVTGLLGFAIAAFVITVPELVAGKSPTSGGHTTLFGGDERDRTRTTETTQTTTTTKTVTAPATRTVTLPARTTTGPTTTAPTTTAPTSTVPTTTVPTVTEPQP